MTNFKLVDAHFMEKLILNPRFPLKKMIEETNFEELVPV